MRILIDMQGVQSESGTRGIGRYVNGLVRGLLDAQTDFEIHLLFNGNLLPRSREIFFDYLTRVDYGRVHVIFYDGPLAEYERKNQDRAQNAEALRGRIIERINPDFFLVSSYFEGFVDDAVTGVQELSRAIPIGLIIYDLIPLDFPDDYLSDPKYKDFYLRKFSELTKFDRCFAISNTTARRIIKTGMFAASAVEMISCGYDKSTLIAAPLSATPVNLQKIILSPGRYLLSVGTFEPRKNYERLVRAFAAIPDSIRAGRQLVCVCNANEEVRNYFATLCAELGILNTDVIATGEISDESLSYLYRNAALYVAPSLCEGFGLPLIEAASHGTVCVCSQGTSLAEIFCIPDIEFDPYDVSSISESIVKLLTNEDSRKRFVAEANERIKAYGWDLVASRLTGALGAQFALSSKT